ncbi:MAG: DnaD domain protein [Blautia sp.]|nr:DnaD domain protein [Blautia sp.]MCM1202383.1 DnaD domain protein [Bacteroides fragilis]
MIDMSHLTIYQDNYTNATVISNRFIDEYMKSANDAQLKIYLYLIRMMSARLSTSVSEIADVFNYTEKDVLRALKYWEKNQLLTLEYDENKNLTGLHLRDLNPAVPVPADPAPASMYVVPISSKTAGPEAETPKTDPYEKPNYTLEQLKAFKSDEATAGLLFITEQYLKKTLSASEIRSILFISDKLGFSEDLIDYLIQYCVDRGKKDLRYMEKVAVNWAQEGITTPEQAAGYAHKYDKTVYDVMKALGKPNMPTQAEITYITRWTKEFSFEFDVISAACEKTVLATDKHRFEYADSILSSWYKAGIRHRNDINALDSRFRQNKAAKTVSTNKFNQFRQNSYDFDALEKELLSN